MQNRYKFAAPLSACFVIDSEPSRRQPLLC